MNKLLKATLAFLLTIAATLGTQSIDAKTFVVGVGVSRYQNNWNSEWPFGAEDVQSIARIFNRQRDADVFVLVNENATKDHIIRILKNKFLQAKASDEIIFLYSGHGNQGITTCYDKDKLLTADEVQSIMRQSKASRKLMFMGSCHSGSFKNPGKSAPGSKYRNSRVVLFLSARPDEESIGFTIEPTSLFFKYLNYGLEGQADKNGDRKVTMRELFNYVYEGVVDECYLVDHDQHPQMYGKFDDDMVIIKY